MKRFFVVSFFLLASALAFPRAGFGVHGGFDCGRDSDSFVSASFRRDTSPWVFSLDAHFSNPLFSDLKFADTFTFVADDYFVNERVSEHMDVYVLWGSSAGFYSDFSAGSGRDFSVGTGSRFGVGFDFFFLNRHLEFFSQAVWNPYLGVKREDGDFNFLGKIDNFPCSVGFRFWN